MPTDPNIIILWPGIEQGEISSILRDLRAVLGLGWRMELYRISDWRVGYDRGWLVRRAEGPLGPNGGGF